MFQLNHKTKNNWSFRLTKTGIILSLLGGGLSSNANNDQSKFLPLTSKHTCQGALLGESGNGVSRTSPPAASDNILLKETPSGLTLDAVEYDKIANEQFLPAFAKGLRAVRKNIYRIRHDQRPPDYENTIQALETMGNPLDLVSSIFGNYLAFKTDDYLQGLAQRIQPLMIKISNSLQYDQKFFERVKTVYEQRDQLNLNLEQKKLLEKTYKSYLRNGINLPEEQKTQLKAIEAQLAKLSLQYGDHLRNHTKAFELVVTDETELKGLPPFSIEAAAERAKAAGKEGWLFTLDQSNYMEIITYAENAQLRETYWRAYNTRASSSPHDNRPILVEIAKLREKMAKILGYKTYGDLVVEERMAKNVDNINQFLDRLAVPYKHHAEKDLKELTEYAGQKLNPWDLAFYSEKLQQAKYAVSDEELRPYFEINRVIQGALGTAEQLYGVRFIPRPDLPVWDPTVKAFEVRDENNEELALFYIDPYYRKSKRGGAWMNSIRSAGIFKGQMRRPHVINVYNFAPPTASGPSLITLDEVRTIFHELGHGLHGMLTRVQSSSLSGTSVAWDAVELPSQIFENWAIEPQVLNQYAVHYKTGETIPRDLVERVQRAKNFQAGMIGLRQILLAKLDLAFHGRDLTGLESEKDLDAWEQQAKAPYTLMDIRSQLASTAFSHIFAGGYASGYYSYKWAEVLAADAYSVFQKNGIFDPETAKKFRSEILEKGGVETPDILYRRFRNQDPDPDALLRSEGLL